jgi:hypothetical protein
VNSNLCVYTAMQAAKFPHVHLEAGGWYLDCSRGFVPDEEESLYSSLVSSAPDVIELEEEPDMPAPQSIEKDVAPVKAKGKGRKLVPHASSQVSTRSYSKASVQRTVAPTTTVVGSPSATPSAPPSDPVPAPSHSDATIPSVPRKRKAVAPDTSATSSERSSSLSLIENVDMGELVEDLMKTKVPPPAYRRIQDFLIKVCVSFCVSCLSFIVFLTFVLILDFLYIHSFQVGTGRTRPNTKPKVHTGIDLLFADVPENLRVPGISASPSDIPQWNKRSSTYFEVLFAFATAHLHDDGVIVFAHAADPEVSREIHNWAHTEDFYVAEDWFGMNDLDLQSPTNPTDLVIQFCLHPF